MSLEKERRHFVSLGNVLTILGFAGALATGWVTLASDNADTKRRVTTVEDRQHEDRQTTQVIVKEVKDDVKETRQDVQLILRKLVEMETARKADDRAARERDRAR